MLESLCCPAVHVQADLQTRGSPNVYASCDLRVERGGAGRGGLALYRLALMYSPFRTAYPPCNPRTLYATNWHFQLQQNSTCTARVYYIYGGGVLRNGSL